MEKEEVLEKLKGKRALIGEMEKAKTDKSNWIAVTIAGIVACLFICIFVILGRKEVCFAIGAICYTWSSSFYFLQYFLAKRPWQVLMGAILSLLGALIMITNFILTICGVI